MVDKLGIAQQTLAHYEVPRIRIPASTLPVLATLFAVPVDVLVGHNQQTKRGGKRGPAPSPAPSRPRSARQGHVLDLTALDSDLTARGSYGESSSLSSLTNYVETT